MKEYKMDEFFREKLANRREIPSDNAWVKLSGELNKGKKRKALVYWYVAAGIVLLMGLGLVFFNLATTEEAMNPIVENNAPLKVEEDVLIASNNDKQLADSPQEKGEQKIEENIIQEPVINNHVALITSDNKIDRQTVKNHQVKFSEDDNLVTEVGKENLMEPETPIIQPEVNETSELLAHQPSKIETEDYPEIIITYKKASTEEKPEKTFKKIVKLAKDITEGGYGLGQLREAKNELLAFEKKKD